MTKKILFFTMLFVLVGCNDDKKESAVSDDKFYKDVCINGVIYQERIKGDFKGSFLKFDSNSKTIPCENKPE